jgi:hydroxymethylglutaryl-CoA reductase
MGDGSAFRLPPNLRKLTVEERRQSLIRLGVSGHNLDATGGPLLDLADVMVESAVGVTSVPLGVATGFLIDDQTVDIPMATEEPSVIAAATYGARLIRRSGGFQTEADEPIMTGEIILEDVSADAPALVREETSSIGPVLDWAMPRLLARGGGFRDLEADLLPDTGLLRVLIHLDVRDAMGANLLNTVFETAGPHLEKITGGRVLMAIISNQCPRRLARARFSMDPGVLSGGGRAGLEVARRIVAASDLAQEDPYRAVTHNKGIMNGISALALATGNDTRGVEAAAHMAAARPGGYRGLSSYSFEDNQLIGRLELPLPLATVGGGVSVHPAAQAALEILGKPDARRLARIGAALGLAQNFAAVRALVTEGIQTGHMRHHAARLAYQAGARDSEIAHVVQRMAAVGVYDSKTAEKALRSLREED